jgi:hypothetical protein
MCFNNEMDVDVLVQYFPGRAEDINLFIYSRPRL